MPLSDPELGHLPKKIILFLGSCIAAAIMLFEEVAVRVTGSSDCAPSHTVGAKINSAGGRKSSVKLTVWEDGSIPSTVAALSPIPGRIAGKGLTITAPGSELDRGDAEENIQRPLHSALL